MQQQKSQAGFEYYLSRLEQEKAKEKGRVSLAVLRTLARSPNGEERLSELVSQFYPQQPTEEELVEFTTVLRDMVDDQLVSMALPEGVQREDYQQLAFSITTTGKKFLDVSNDTLLNFDR
jgi:hypothetical protein